MSAQVSIHSGRIEFWSSKSEEFLEWDLSCCLVVEKKILLSEVGEILEKVVVHRREF